jgi:Asp-tRNA(Asn)/Glu-tRNA(Gln) amidotransferase A subunit family amidase
MSELCDLSAVELRAMIGRKTISPSELMTASIERIENIDPILNAIPIRDFDRAMDNARQADKTLLAGDPLPPLFGLPLGVKDLNDVAGLPTVKGSPRLLDHVAAEDERVVAAMKRAGAIVVGKTNVPEMGFGATTDNPVFGITRNPFAPERSAGASSGGSAVALASGMVPLAMGSDFAGSLRTPASFCGIGGMRPSPGVAPYEHRPFVWSPLDVLGPMGRAAADMKLLLGAMADFDSRDPFAAPVEPSLLQPTHPIDLSGLRVAFSYDLGGLAPVEQQIKDAFKAKAETIKDAFLDARWFEPNIEDAYRAFYILRGVDFVGEFEETYRSEPETLGPDIHFEMERALKLTPGDMAWAQAAQSKVYRAAQAMFEEIDLLITPAASVPPFPHEERFPKTIDGKALDHYLDWEAISWVVTMLANPAVVVPAGLGPTGLPMGLQIVGPYRRDGWLLDVAHTLERSFAADPDLARPIAKVSELNGKL